METTQQCFVETSNNSILLQRPHDLCGQWPTGQSLGPWVGQSSSDTGTGPMDCSQAAVAAAAAAATAAAADPQFERMRHLPPSFGQYLQHTASADNAHRALPDVPTYNGYVVNWVLSSSSSSHINVAQAEGAPASCPSPCATPNGVHSARGAACRPPSDDSLTPHVCRALDELAGQQQSSPDEPLFGRKDQLSVNWTTYWDDRESCFKLLYVGQPRLQMQCNSNSKGEMSCKRKHPSGYADAEDTDVDDIKLSKVVKLVNIRHVTFAPEFV